MNRDTLAEAYLRNGKEDFWAWEQVHQAVETDLNEGWKVTLLLLERATSDRDVSCVAAGPLEHLIDRYGHKALDLDEAECANNSRLRLALSMVGVLFYYDEFERFYGLLYRYGLRTDRVADSALIGRVMGIMKSYLSDTIEVYEYADRIIDVLDKPFEDKTAQQILQRARWDVEVIDSKRPPDYREPYITRAELIMRVRQTVAELEQLGYQASSIH